MNKLKSIIKILIVLIALVSIERISYATSGVGSYRMIQAMFRFVQVIIFGIAAIWFLFRICKWIIRLIVYKKKIKNRR